MFKGQTGYSRWSISELHGDSRYRGSPRSNQFRQNRSVKLLFSYLESLEKLKNLQSIIEQEVLESKQKFAKLQNDYDQLNELYSNLSANIQYLGYEVDNYGDISVIEYSYDIDR